MAVRIEKHAEPIPGYRLIDRLGGGGFGEVWRAEAPGGLLKAIKFVYGDLQDMGDDGQRAEQELKALSRVKTVRHPYILSLERFDIIDGQLLIVTELADRNLWDRYKDCRAEGLPGIPRPELLSYLQEVAEALDLMNIEYGLQHLDIKPQNLFLVHQHIKVGDFGLVKDLEGMRASVTGGVTPVYAAPETFDGWVSRFCDQYSLAIVYQELLTGQRPFVGGTVRQLVMQHLQAQPDLSSLPEAERPIIGRALSKNPDERYPTCKELIQALRQAGSAAPISALCPEGREWVPPVTPGRHGLLDTPVQEPEEESPDGSAEPTHCLHGRDSTPAPAEPVAPPQPAPEEISGEGALYPAVVIGVGDLGRTVLQQLAAAVHRRFGSREAIPCLRLLLIDTDPGALKAATQGPPEEALCPQEVLLTPLNRPAHYLKSRDGRAALDSWLNQQILYRIPRARLTLGVRALGRLAFCDHYRSVARRLRSELEACLEPEALTTAARQTGVGLRSNRPRVYVVAGLAGGTGGGMFLDLAYVLRAQLRQLGYGHPDVVGLFAIPSVGPTPASEARQAVRTRALGNAYAALTELTHFATPGRKFSARYHESEPPVQETEPPFQRCILLPLGEGEGEGGAAAVAGRVAEFLARELCSPLGEAAAAARSALQGPPWAERGLYCQTFGLYRWASPRRLMMQQAARRLCARLLERWMTKDAGPLRDAIAARVSDHWQREEWGPESVVACLEEAARRVLGREPEEAFAALLEPLACRLPAENGRGRVPVTEVDQKLLMQVVNDLEALVGPPPEEEVIGQAAQLPDALRDVVRNLVIAWGQKVGELMIHFIEEPGVRLAGAEEAARQVVARIEQVLAEHEPLAREAAARSSEAFKQLRTAAVTLLKQAAAPAKARPTVTLAEVVDLCRLYAAERYQALVQQQAVAAYVSLRGQLSDQLREVNYCRARLDQLLRRFTPPRADESDAETADARPPVTPVGMPRLLALADQNGAAAAPRTHTSRPADDCGTGPGRWLFPDGCRTLDEAVERYLERVPPELMHELDGRMQEVMRKRFSALVHVCLSSSNMLPDVERAMSQEAEAFVTAHAPWGNEANGNVAELFLAEYPEDEDAESAIATAYAAADPLLSGGRNTGQTTAELCLLLTPQHPAAGEIGDLAQAALPEANLQVRQGGEDLVLYRERPYLPLADLEQLGAVGEEAYRQVTALEHCTPHTRLDVPFTSP